MKETRAKLIAQRLSSPEQGKDLQPIFVMSGGFTGSASVQPGVRYIRCGSSP
jgi:hypothetical protein